MTPPEKNYAHPETLVETAWVAEHLADPRLRIAEVDYDPSANYALGHLPGAVLFDWRKDINDPVRRDILSREGVAALLTRAGVGPGTTLLLYGDFNNWFAAFAFWVLTHHGVKDVRLINGGRKKWIEEDRPLTKEVPSYPAATPRLDPTDEKLRVFHDYVRDVLPKVKAGSEVLVDVRGPKEFTGEVTAPPEYPTEHAQRGGHIPGATNIPWAQAVNENGTFKSRAELEKLYTSKGVTPEKEVITYCRIGERSSHSWFVLKYLLGYPNVRNYDGSWTEWGNQIRSPIERP
ncbi:MAG: sulfurtransferase [Euryarchaeota archaeon]|nr:sulfurtransferase [Euryarchaeota archaeon]MDE1835435.1 sulfurtransferase [Euryarchaeota archaeon]MDE1879571.1 sulfurtransferase [Euryarchaeota archaeon]MDE2046086.1 sulfurtransferase [Thermoplasmata archaeon]